MHQPITTPNFIMTSETSCWGAGSGSGTFQWLVTTEVVFKSTLCVSNLRRNFPFETQKHKEPVCDKNHVQFLQACFASFVKLTRFFTKGHPYCTHQIQSLNHLNQWLLSFKTNHFIIYPRSARLQVTLSVLGFCESLQ